MIFKNTKLVSDKAKGLLAKLFKLTYKPLQEIVCIIKTMVFLYELK